MGELAISRLLERGPRPIQIYLDMMAWPVFAVWDVVRYRNYKAFSNLNPFEFLDHLVGNRY